MKKTADKYTIMVTILLVVITIVFGSTAIYLTIAGLYGVAVLFSFVSGFASGTLMLVLFE